jgi:hypothetical protein
MSHLNLSQAFARLKIHREVWVYDKENLLKGSPFNSYADACEAIKIIRTSMVVRRYIDTGKLYDNRYLFYSSPFIPFPKDKE